MHAFSDTQSVRNFAKKCILFILVFTMVTACFGTVLAPQADAASYRVKFWKKGNDNYYYGLYSGSLPDRLYPTFSYHPSSDEYKSGLYKIRFYWPEFYGNEANREMTQTFCKYIAKNCQSNYTWSYNTYPVDYSPNKTAFYPFLIVGWRCDKHSIDKLLDQSPFVNSDGTKLYLEYIGEGDYVDEFTPILKDDLEASFAHYYRDSNVTIAFRFVDRWGNPLYLYFPDS